MEITVYELQKKYDEFKDLSYNQLMKIAELIIHYHANKESSLVEALRCEIYDLEDENEGLMNDLNETKQELEWTDEKLMKAKNTIKEVKNKLEKLERYLDD